jgi:hypothetical protein
MNEEQLEKIEKEIWRLANKSNDISLSLDYSIDIKNELKTYIHGRIDSLKW